MVITGGIGGSAGAQMPTFTCQGQPFGIDLAGKNRVALGAAVKPCIGAAGVVWPGGAGAGPGKRDDLAAHFRWTGLRCAPGPRTRVARLPGAAGSGQACRDGTPPRTSAEGPEPAGAAVPVITTAESAGVMAARPSGPPRSGRQHRSIHAPGPEDARSATATWADLAGKWSVRWPAAAGVSPEQACRPLTAPACDPPDPGERAVSVAGTTMPAVTFRGSAVRGEPGDHHRVAVVPIRHAQDSRRPRRIPR